MSDINWNELNASDIYCLLINAPDHYDDATHEDAYRVDLKFDPKANISVAVNRLSNAELLGVILSYIESSK